MSDEKKFVCGHNRTHVAGTKDYNEDCQRDLRTDAANATTGSDREILLRVLLNDPLCVPFSLLHEIAEKLVGRPVWTHEFARPEHLFAEARTHEHPPDLEAHVIGSLDQIAGTKPVLIVRPE